MQQDLFGWASETKEKSKVDIVREQSSRIFQQFLISYPMAKKRLEWS